VNVNSIREQTAMMVRQFVLMWLAATPVYAGNTNHTNEPAALHQGTGVHYTHDEVKEVPWSVHIVTVDRTRSDLRLETTLGLGSHTGMATVSEQVKLLPADWGHPIAAINGDFFKNENPKYPGDPEGLQILHGELVSAPRPTHSCFWIDATGQPHVAVVTNSFSAVLPNGTSLNFGLNQERGNEDAVLFTSANGATTRASGGLELVLTRGAATNWLPLKAGQTYTATVKEVRTQGDAPLSRNTMVLSVGPKISGSLGGVKKGDPIKISGAATARSAGGVGLEQNQFLFGRGRWAAKQVRRHDLSRTGELHGEPRLR
jgi:hypothetical protein